MKKLLSLILTIAVILSLAALPAQAAVSTMLSPMISFGQAELPEGATAWGAVYDKDGRMIHMATAVEKNGDVRIPVPESKTDDASTARLFLLQGTTLIPLGNPVDAKSGPVNEVPVPGANAIATVVTGKLLTEVETVAELVAAIDESGNSVVTLLKDITTENTISISYSCTLDLNGHTLKTTATGSKGLDIRSESTDNHITTIKNGTLHGSSCAIAWRSGALKIQNSVIIGEKGHAIWILNSGDSNAASYKDINLIEDSTVWSKDNGAISFNSTGGNFSAVSLRIEGSDLIAANTGVVLTCTSGETKPGTYVLGKSVNLYTKGTNYVKTATPAPALAGESISKAIGTHTFTVQSTTISNLNKWGTSLSEEDLDILQARREAAETYLRELSSIRWRSDVDLTYTHTGDGTGSRWNIVKDRLYEGLPYSYAGASAGAWLDHPGTMDENGIYNMTGLSVALIGGTSTSSRIGIDCSGTLSHSWQSIGASIRTESTNAMTPNSGFLRVGDYKAPEDQYESTKTDCTNNGTAVMYEAYAQLQKADGMVTSNGSGHARFVVDVKVVRNQNGSINGSSSTVTFIEQNGLMSSGQHYYDSTLKENVYLCMTVDKTYTFSSLYSGGYLPVTCKELIDPAPIAAPKITDSVTTPTKSNLFDGTVSCNWALDNITITIADKSGKTVQSSLLHPKRRTELAVKMSQFNDDMRAGKTAGVIDLSKLASGTYRCTVTARTVAGHVIMFRDFSFNA